MNSQVLFHIVGKLLCNAFWKSLLKAVGLIRADSDESMMF